MPNRNKEFLSSNFRELTLKTDNQILELQPNIHYIFGRSPKDSKKYPPGLPNLAYINLLPHGRPNFSLEPAIVAVYENYEGILISKFKTSNLVSFSQHDPKNNPEKFIFNNFEEIVGSDQLHRIFIIANDTSVTTLTYSTNHHQSILTVNFD